ncbi:hypothetical protein B0H11DRAFT_476377 [Mycena galericulata]|nr:hypothetical protein B0H11DRAFT_476377 [Mycena galericulata]
MSNYDSATAVLGTPELLAYILDFLHDSKEDLKSCALVSRAFTFPAQSHLFQSIHLYRSPELLLAPTPLHDFDDLEACTRLSEIMEFSPHLRSLVRRVGAAVDTHILTHLTDIGFPRLEHLTLVILFPGAVDFPALSIARDMLAQPSIKTFVFGGNFRGLGALGLLFSRCTPGLRTLDLRYVSVLPGPGIAPGEPPDFRVQLTHMELLNPGREVAEWFLDPRCPLDFSQLRRVNVVKAVTPSLIEILEAARLKITVLHLHTHDAAAGLDLARFPVLTDLRIVGSPAEMEPAFARLAFAPENTLTNLQHIALASRTFTFDDPTPLERIAALLASLSLPALVQVELTMLKPVIPDDYMIDVTRERLASRFSELVRRRPGVLLIRDFREWERHGSE